jgi:DNA-binding transcriptional LysR family regulator
MELRQLHYFVTLAEELHFGRAAHRCHIVQSALSQQLQRLERELDVSLLHRTTHHVQLTSAGRAFLPEARELLAHADRAKDTAWRAAHCSPILRVCNVDASYDSMPRIIRAVQERYADLEIHQLEACVPDQYERLVDGRADVGIGRASMAPPEVASELFRLDPLGVLVAQTHRFASMAAVPVALLSTDSLLLAEQRRAPEFNEFVIEMCRAVGFVPTSYSGTVESALAAAELVAQSRCLVCVPASCRAVVAGVVWRPLIQPSIRYPWSVLWRVGDSSEHVQAVVSSARSLEPIALLDAAPYGH